MITTRTTLALLGASLLAMVTHAALWPATAQAEWYVSGQFGVTLPSIGKGLSDVDIVSSGLPDGTTMSDRALKSSLLYGAKLGYFFPRAKWLGLQTEFFNTTPHIKQQATSITVPSAGSATGVLTGDHFRVFTWAPLNVVLRYHRSRLQPYIAIGPGLFFARVKTTQTGFEGSQSSTKLGLNAEAGLEYYITRHLTVFGEGKFNYARFNFPENDAQFGFNGTYKIFHVAFGLGYHF
jgi:opacity protein-like surface antigen